MPDRKTVLKIDEIQKTIERLILRISDRFPHSGLSLVCQTLYEISKETDKTVHWISRPNMYFRMFIALIVIVLGFLLFFSIQQLHPSTDGLNVSDYVQMTEAGINEIFLIGAGVIFLVTIEIRRKRSRVINSLNRLRCIAHIIDAHQLTKDPAGVTKINLSTTHSPDRTLNEYELCRYLDYCSEMLSLVSKIGFLYVQKFDDSIANDAVNDLEELTNGLSTKIWQKIMIIRFNSNSAK